ncbi:MAG: DNA recombination protein RmuC, partial [Caulobacteraceae bacterium]
MNPSILLVLATLFSAAVAIALAFWAVAERARAERADLRARLIEGHAAAGAEALEGQAALVANAVAEGLVKRAQESFAAQDALTRATLGAQRKPVADTLAKFEVQVTAAEKARAEQAGGLKAQIEQLMMASAATQDEARKLSAALRRGAALVQPGRRPGQIMGI